MTIVVITDKRSERYPAGACCAIGWIFRFDELYQEKGQILMHGL